MKLSKNSDDSAQDSHILSLNRFKDKGKGKGKESAIRSDQLDNSSRFSKLPTTHSPTKTIFNFDLSQAESTMSHITTVLAFIQPTIGIALPLRTTL